MSRMGRKRKQEADATPRDEMRRLLEAAKAEPWDIGARLALADWLEEHGGEADRARAEIIRLQLDTDNGGPRWHFAVERLREKHVREWVGPLRGLFARKLPACERGLLVSDVSSRAWITADDNALAGGDEWAWVETARFQAFPSVHIKGLLSSHLLAGVPCLDINVGLPALTLRALAAEPNLGRRRSLRVLVYGIARDVLADDFMPSPNLAGLSELEMNCYRPGLRVWQGLAAAEGLAGLRRLHLGRCAMDDDGAAVLAASPNLRQLRELTLDFAHFGERGAAALLRSPTFTGLRRLTIARTQLGHALPLFKDAPFLASLERLSLEATFRGAPSLADLPRPPRLRYLSLAHNVLRPEAFDSLVRAPLLGGLDGLNLSSVPLGERGAAVLASSGLQAPRGLRLRGCNLGNNGVAHLASWPGLARVRFLDLGDNGLRLEGVRALAESPHVDALEALDLSDNRALGPLAVELLARSPLAARLRWLWLGGLPLEAAAKRLAAHPMARLRELHVALRPAGNLGALARLRAAMPDCAIG
jgi:uncharacterized protein (TIGR02996 family)